MGDIGSAFSSGLSDLGSSASSALSGFGSAFSGLSSAFGGGGSSAGGAQAPASPQPTPAQTQPVVSPQAAQAMSVNPPTLPSNTDQPDPNQKQDQKTPPALPAVAPSTIADIIKGLGLTAPEMGVNPWLLPLTAGAVATATPADTGELKPGQPGFIPPSSAGGSTTNMDPQTTPYGGTGDQPARPVTPTPRAPIGGGAGNVQEAPTNVTAAGTPAADTPLPPPRPGDAAAGTPAPKIALGGGPGNTLEAPTGTPAADAPAEGASPASATAPGGGAGGAPGQQDGMGMLQQILGMALPMIAMAAMGGRGGGGMMLPMMMSLMGGGMFGRGGFGQPGWRPGWMERGFRGGVLRPGYYPNGRGGIGFHAGGWHPGWAPAGANMAASAIQGANVMRGRGRFDPAVIHPFGAAIGDLGIGKFGQAGAAAGVMGESGVGMDPTSFNSKDPGGGSGGIGQWNRGRLIGPSGMLAFAQNHGVNVDPMNPRDSVKVPRDVQIAYMKAELASPKFAHLRAELAGARSPQEALWYWIRDYEAPADPVAAYNQRSQYLGNVVTTLNQPGAPETLPSAPDAGNAWAGADQPALASASQ